MEEYWILLDPVKILPLKFLKRFYKLLTCAEELIYIRSCGGRVDTKKPTTSPMARASSGEQDEPGESLSSPPAKSSCKSAGSVSCFNTSMNSEKISCC